MLRLLVLVNLFCLAGALVRAGGFDQLGSTFLTLSVVVQPGLILTLLMLCGARQLLGELSPARQWVLFLVVACLSGVAAYLLMGAALPSGARPGLLQFLCLYLFIVAVVVHYFDLRARALLPSVTEARLQALQSRIRPHFLFNSMNAALSLVRSEPARAEQVLENLADLFRALMNDNRQLVRLDEEVNLCLNYLEIEQIRLGDRLQVTWNIEAMPAAALVPPLLLQPLVENAVYHGVEPLDGPGEIAIEIVERGAEIVITLTNPLPEPNGAAHGQGNRMAVANIKERLLLHFDFEARLEVAMVGPLYRVTITLPRLEGPA